MFLPSPALRLGCQALSRCWRYVLRFFFLCLQVLPLSFFFLSFFFFFFFFFFSLLTFSTCNSAAGVIDADYRGNVGVVMFNFNTAPYKVARGDRIAQLVLERIYTPDVVEVAASHFLFFLLLLLLLTNRKEEEEEEETRVLNNSMNKRKSCSNYSRSGLRIKPSPSYGLFLSNSSSCSFPCVSHNHSLFLHLLRLLILPLLVANRTLTTRTEVPVGLDPRARTRFLIFIINLLTCPPKTQLSDPCVCVCVNKLIQKTIMVDEK